jgi:choline-phosphate cytidylyltransferase
MDSSTESFHHHKKTLHSKRSFAKHHSKDSPTYDASEEDNDPLSTDDGGSSMSIPAISRSAKHPFQSKAASRARHQLASSMLSDDGTDSQTYDGDVESSVTAAAGSHPFNKTLHPTLQHSSSASTLTSQIDDVLVSSESVALAPDEPIPTAEATSTFNPAALTPEHIQAFIREAIEGKSPRSYKINQPPLNRPVRIFADGVYDLFHFGHALQLRQAKLSFPSVHLLVGVNSDEDVVTHKARCVMTHAERCEAVRHCRWVDEVIPGTPWVLDQAFIDKWNIDYVAHDEVPYVSGGYDDVYAFVKALGKFIPTRRTPGVSTSELLERIVSGYRRRDFDGKLEMMGHAELKAEGSDFDDKR